MLIIKPILKVVHFLQGNPFCTLGGFIPPSVYKNLRSPFLKKPPPITFGDKILRPSINTIPSLLD